MKNPIKVERARGSMTQHDLTTQAGISRQTINHIETRRYMLSVALALKLFEIFRHDRQPLFLPAESDRK